MVHEYGWSLGKLQVGRAQLWGLFTNESGRQANENACRCQTAPEEAKEAFPVSACASCLIAVQERLEHG